MKILLLSSFLIIKAHAGALSESCLGSYKWQAGSQCPKRVNLERNIGMIDLFLVDASSGQQVNSFLHGLGFALNEDGSSEEYKGDIKTHSATTVSEVFSNSEIIFHSERSLVCDEKNQKLLYQVRNSESVIDCQFIR